MNVKNCAKINLALLFDRIDTQNAFTAMKMFNYNAERWMSQKGYNETAQFIKLVRNSHASEGGISVSRFEIATEITKFLKMCNSVTFSSQCPCFFPIKI